MARALPFFVVVALTVYSFVDAVQTDPAEVRTFAKPWWLLIVLIPLLGPLAWLVAGRPGRFQPPSPGPRQSPRLPPDDDPDFLRRLREEGGDSGQSPP